MEGLEKELSALETKLVGKSQEEVKNALADFKVKNEEAIENAVKSAKEELEGKMQAIQDHADALDIKLQKKEAEPKDGEDLLTKSVKDNFEAISTITKSNGFKTEIKNMTLGANLTGDQPRDYNNDVVVRPAQMSNVEDLARVMPVTGGTYTYTRSVLTSGTVGAAAENVAKNELVYTYTMVDANTDYIAGISIYSKKMRNNLSWLESTLSTDLRRDYMKGENAAFEAILAAEATASTQIITGKNKIQMLINEIATLADINFAANGVVVRPSDYYDILTTEVSTGAGYGLPGVVTMEGGVMRINGIPVLMATWVPADKYYVGNWSRVSKVVTEGFSFEVSEQDADNFQKNNITARVEAQVTLTVEQPDAIIYGDFTAV